jgi:hypothetical protein
MDRLSWNRSTGRRVAALTSAVILIGWGWISQAVYPLPVAVSEYASASFGSFCASASTYGRAEDVRVIPVVIPKLELGDST